ncbi:MAG: pyruvate ferredoxin oxidoreductase [Thermodesulfobacteriota bacterium]|nr:pyruvate ferredoxin oxidoreductase [Thermodesulfobacteriota bacterium]
MRKVLTGNQAVAYGAMLSDIQVVAAYPITPQTTIIEELADMQADGRVDIDYIRVESEHSAMAACIGASMGGVRTFTATCGQGLFLMHEMLHYASGARVPIVMANVNRAAAAPWSIWSDQTDSISQRDTGWIQLYCEGNQEVLDTTIMAFKIAESIRLPIMVVLDAFFLSHTSEPVDIPDVETVKKFLPPFDPGEIWLDPDNPKSFGGITMSNAYMEFRWQVQRDMEKAKGIITTVHKEFEDAFGRLYHQVEEYKTENADIVLVLSGTVASTGRDAIDMLRDRGENTGMIKMKTLRPFPREDVIAALKGKKKVAIIDRNFSPGATGVWAQEIKNALYELPENERPLIYGYVAGLGGRDISTKTIEEVYNKTKSSEKPDDVDIWIGVKYV